MSELRGGLAPRCGRLPALYFTVRPFYPTLARGLGRGILFRPGLLLLGVVLMAVVALGLLIVCSLNQKP